MNIPAISHRSNPEYNYALDNDTVAITLKTAKDVDRAFIVWEDPFIHELKRCAWDGVRKEMELYLELKDHYIWRVKITPKYKRVMYYFVVMGQDEEYTIFENKITPSETANVGAKQYFKFPWLNPSDVTAPPKWVSNTVWYQIMPDRFCRADGSGDDPRFRPWGSFSDPGWHDLFGGNLKGITQRLPYLHSLGIGGIYMTPIFHSGSNHKYDTFDYKTIDPDFGTEEDLIELVREAHSLGIKVMLDAVFNHCGRQFAPWQDVCKNGKDSPYYDWFFINSEDFARDDRATDDARIYSFSFTSKMPKLNTNNPEVIEYFTNICMHWAEVWRIDGIRFDVGDEVSHTFLRHIYSELKSVAPDIYLLGEIWNDSLVWVSQKEFDAVMNYPFCSCSDNFWSVPSQTFTDFMYAINYCRSLYPEQVTNALFNFLDTHDTARAIDGCENEDVFLQKLTVLMTMPGTPCIYYGTEIAMHGKHNPYNRACMPWDEIDAGKYDEMKTRVSDLIKLRNSDSSLSSGDIEFCRFEEYPRLICYAKAKKTRIYINAEDRAIPVSEHGDILYSNGWDGTSLAKDGILIIRSEF